MISSTLCERKDEVQKKSGTPQITRVIWIENGRLADVADITNEEKSVKGSIEIRLQYDVFSLHECILITLGGKEHKVDM